MPSGPSTCMLQWQIWAVNATIRSLLEACRTLYDNITNRQMFLTGSIGAAADGECFTCDYDLPNKYNYSETCASIGLAMFR